MRRKLIVGALGAAALAASVSAFTSTAPAMPIRGVTTGTQGSTFYVAAAAYSPATADGCGGYYGVGLYSGGARVRERFGRFNACRYNVRGGVTYGLIGGAFNVSNLPRGNYGVCLYASQNIQGGRAFPHAVCRIRRVG